MGIRHASPVVDVSGTSPVDLWKVTVNRKAKLTKVVIYNADTADHKVELGEYDGTMFVAKLPPIPVLAGQLVVLEESDLPSAYVASSDTQNLKRWAARLEAGVTSSNVKVQIEVEEE